MSYFHTFHLSDWRRNILIQEQLFYVDQAKKRLFSQFIDIHQEAEDVTNNWLVENENKFNPDQHNGADFLAEAADIGNHFYMLLDDMRKRTILSVVAGMYHEWDKQLREWIIMHSNCDEEKVWNCKISKLFNLFEELDFKIKETSCYSVLDACRLVVNVYKHGQGPAFDTLCGDYPKYLNVNMLEITPEHVDEFSDAIVSFWREVPEYMGNSSRIYDDSTFDDM